MCVCEGGGSVYEREGNEEGVRMREEGVCVREEGVGVHVYVNL